VAVAQVVVLIHLLAAQVQRVQITFHKKAEIVAAVEVSAAQVQPPELAHSLQTFCQAVVQLVLLDQLPQLVQV
jgi:hypothetical protein